MQRRSLSDKLSLGGDFIPKFSKLDFIVKAEWGKDGLEANVKKAGVRVGSWTHFKVEHLSCLGCQKVLEILVPKLLNAETKEFHAWMFELLIFPHQPECMRLLAFGSLFIFCQAFAVFSVHVFKSLAIIDKVQVPCPIHSGSPSRGVEVVDGINLVYNSSIAKKIGQPFNISIPVFQSCTVFCLLTKKCTVAKNFCYKNCSCIGKC